MKKPNIIFIFSDQQRYSAVGCNGNPIVKTPNIDSLAKEGVSFDNAFSSCPLCSPYRAQLLTGKYSHTNGVMDNQYELFQDQAFLPEVLGKNGYKSAFIGKWHLGLEPYPKEKRYGFDYMAAYNCQHNHNKIRYFENEQGWNDIEGYGPTGETDLALKFIENHQKNNTEESFCVLMSWGPPHWDFSEELSYDDCPDSYKTYDPETVDLPKNVPKQMEAFARKELAQYYGSVSALDNEVGRIMKYLKENNLEENTIICYSSDHGDHLSSHGYGKPADDWLHSSKRASKGTPYEESIHIPFIMRYPTKVPKNTRLKTMFNSVDIMPTLLGLTNIDLPEGIQGTDISHCILGEKGEEPDSVYLQLLGGGWPDRRDWVGVWRGLRNQRWTYARWFETGDIWLFDRENDPLEMNNLAGNIEFLEIQEKLELRLQKWMEETNDPFDTGERDEKRGMLKLGQKILE